MCDDFGVYLKDFFKYFTTQNQKRIYLDYAAATPINPQVLKAMDPYLRTHIGNPSAIHTEGRIAREAIEDARVSVAHTLHVRPEEVTFTSGGTESNNLAIVGTVSAIQKEAVQGRKIEIITTKIEHPSVLETVRALESEHVTVRYAALHEDGTIDEGSVQSLLTRETVLVTFAYVNSEIGTVQDVKKISRIVRKFNTEHGTQVFVHLDASQAPLWLPCQVDMLGVDLMTLDAGKCGGPKGGGVLVHKNRVALSPVLFGGGQEEGLRGGTENTPLIVGCARALDLAQMKWTSRSEAVASLRDVFIEELRTTIPEVVLNGSQRARVANNVNVSIGNFDSEFAVVVLDSKGVAASTRSACSGTSGSGSHVVLELTGDKSRAASTLRFTLGEGTTKKDIEKTVTVLKEHIDRMRTI